MHGQSRKKYYNASEKRYVICETLQHPWPLLSLTFNNEQQQIFNLITPTLDVPVFARIRFPAWLQSLYNISQKECTTLDDTGAFCLVALPADWDAHVQNIVNTAVPAVTATTTGVTTTRPPSPLRTTKSQFGLAQRHSLTGLWDRSEVPPIKHLLSTN